MSKYIIRFFISLFIVHSTCFAGTVFTKRLNYKIVIPDKPSKIEQFAAAELSKFINEIYDADINLNNTTSDITFFIGVSSEAIKADFTDIPDLKTNFGVFRKKHFLLFYGYNDDNVDPVKNNKGYTGTLSAVYYFLNKYTGLTFLFPGNNGYRFTKNKHISFPGENDLPTPSFQLRSVSMNTKEYKQDEMILFFRRMLGNVPYWSINDYFYVFMNNWKKRFWKTNPEFFMLRDGKRVNEKYPRHIPCLSNPDVIRQTAADIVEKLNSNSELKTVRLFCDAPIFQCQCSRCRKSKERSFAKNDSQSGEEFYGFQKKVAEIVRQSHPQVNFFTQTKGRSYQNPPKLIKLGDYFTVAQIVPRVNPQSNFEDFVDLAKKWKDAGVRTILKSYPRYDIKTYAGCPIMTPYFTVKYFRMFEGIVDGAYKMDRLSRSLLDFMKLTEMLEQHNVSFVSVTQDINTSTSSGRMMLNILMTFCQYEREIIADRVRDRVAGKKRRGKHCGGPPVLGYDVDPKNIKLIINPDEAAVVREAFILYTQYGSAKETAHRLNGMGYRTKAWTSRKNVHHGGEKFAVDTVYRMLNNPIYIGEVRHKDKSYPGEHEAIIDRQLWNLVHELMKENAPVAAGYHKNNITSPFKGLLRCGHCGGAFGISYARNNKKNSDNRRYMYYLCIKDEGRAERRCPLARIPAGDIDRMILEQMARIIKTPSMLAMVYNELRAYENQKRKAVKRQQRELEAKREKIRKQMLAGGDPAELRRQFAETEDRLARLKSQTEELGREQSVHDLLNTCDSIGAIWEELFPVERYRLVHLLFARIRIFNVASMCLFPVNCNIFAVWGINFFKIRATADNNFRLRDVALFGFSENGSVKFIYYA